jgi:atypical dual specificity phosphatase
MKHNSKPLNLWWVQPGVLGGMSMPFLDPRRHDPPGHALEAFADELPGLWQAGVRAVVCLLNMPSATTAYTSAGFSFLCLSVNDGDAPTREQFEAFLHFVAGEIEQGRAVAVHCEAGIGRTGVMLAGYLVAGGLHPDSAVRAVRALQAGAVETGRQMQFLFETHRDGVA